MKERGISFNSNKLDPFIQKYGGAWELDKSSIPDQLKLILTKGTHYELVPKQAGMALETFQDLLQQVKLKPFNSWPQ